MSLESMCLVCQGRDGQIVMSDLNVQDSVLVNFMRLRHAQLRQDEARVCGSCVDAMKHDWDEAMASPHRTDEPTVNTEREALIAKMPALEKKGHPVLLVLHGGQTGKRFEIHESPSLIGRSSEAHVQIIEKNISRKHAQILFEDDRYWLEDLGSTNGTFLNTVRVEKETLADGDIVLLGNAIFKFMKGSNIEHRYHDELYQMATMDGLTGTLNKSFFEDRLFEECHRARRYHRALSVLLLDVDHFSKVNNVYGHLAGDHILREMCREISQKLRKEDVFGRIGGEEFAIVFPEVPHQGALVAAEKVRALIESLNIKWNHKAIPLTVSIGVASLTDDTSDAKALLAKADDHLYEAKDAGRNQVKG